MGVGGDFSRARIGLALEVSVGRVDVVVISVGGEAVLGIVAALGDAARGAAAQAVAVLVVGVGGNNLAVLSDLFQASFVVVGVGVGGARSLDGLGLLGDAAQGVALVRGLIQLRRAGEGFVGVGLPEGVVGPLVGGAREGGAGHEAALGVAGDVEGAGLGYEIIIVVGVRDFGAVYAYAGDAQVGAVL